MKSRIIFRCSIIVNRLTSVLLGTGLLFSAVTAMAECESSKGIASNEIYSPVGNGDTLWMLSWDAAKSQYSINSIIHQGDTSRLNQDKNWTSLSLGCINSDINDLTYGGGKAVLCFDTLKSRQINPILVLTNNSGSIQQQRADLEWPGFLKDSNQYIFTTKGVAWAKDAFYFACLDGGMVKWDYQNETRTVFLPGKSPAMPISDFTASKIANDTTKRVVDVKKCKDDIMVVTPAKIWRFSTTDSSWDSSISSKIIDTTLVFKEFETVFISPDRDSIYYSKISVKKKISRKDTTILAKYSNTGKYWICMLDQNVYNVTFGPGDYIFTFGDNSINAYRDTLASSFVTKTPVINSSVFENWITQNFTVGNPEFTDILYLPISDSAGYLWVASTEGIFFTKWQFPVKSKVDFTQIKRAPSIKAGLEQTFARPGILVSGLSDKESWTVFVYNVSKDTKVTIRVYDYNMDLVKTITNNKFRCAGSNGGHHGRSTVESEDRWDGRNSLGKMVAPGIYYYKITTDIGERAFGKIVVAK
ncbi:MAG TPA: hypothetical protein VHO70_19240 [Chitinispirillaceae bacterium]|nr:hypothetical protein [Chitinispirillaceae bacterium]